MIRRTFSWIAVFTLLNFPVQSALADVNLPTVSEACDVLKAFRGEYSYGGWGDGAQSNDGEVAAWIIFHSTNAVKTLTELYPQCHTSGKAYVLAALYHADRKAFQALKDSFSREGGQVIVASGCEGWSVSRTELATSMQKRKSTLAFDPSRKPHRHSGLAFVGSSRDVYEEQRQFEQKQKDRQEKAYNSLVSNPNLSPFTNLFQIKEAREDYGSIYGTYFFSDTDSEWSAHFLPREKLPFEAMVEVVFPKSNAVVQVGLNPSQLIDELKALTAVQFLRDLDKQLVLHCVRIRAAGDRMHWDTSEVEEFEASLKTGVPIRDWVQFIVDAGSRSKQMIEFYHPIGTDIYVVDGSLFENPDWREQYRKITGKTPKKMKGLDAWEYPDSKFLPVVDRFGKLRLLPSAKEP